MHCRIWISYLSHRHLSDFFSVSFSAGESRQKTGAHQRGYCVVLHSHRQHLHRVLGSTSNWRWIVERSASGEVGADILHEVCLLHACSSRRAPPRPDPDKSLVAASPSLREDERLAPVGRSCLLWGGCFGIHFKGRCQAPSSAHQ